MNFKDNLRKARIKARLSQESLAEQLSVSRQTISKWENGETYPSTRHILMLTEYLNCDLGSLISYDSVNLKGSLNNHDPVNSASNQSSLIGCDPVNSVSSQSAPKHRLWPFLAFSLASLIVLSFSLTSIISVPKLEINNAKLAAFDQIIDGSLAEAIRTFAPASTTEKKIVGYGITEPDGTFFVKCNLSSGADSSCTAIIYFCEENGHFSYKCQYLDDPDYLPQGKYYQIS